MMTNTSPPMSILQLKEIFEAKIDRLKKKKKLNYTVIVIILINNNSRFAV